MSIKKYTNFEDIKLKHENEGKFILDKDLFVVSTKELEETDFGSCKYDVMEVSIYDINNNLLPHVSGNKVAYIKSGDIKNYLYNITNNSGQRELAINAEKLLSDLGFKNGILKLNINFVRNKFGEDNEERRAWVQEISATRQEIRIVPLKVKDKNITTRNADDLVKMQNLHKDFKYYRNQILQNIYSFENTFLDSINSYLESKFGKDFFNILKNDFGLSKFDDFKKKIIDDFNLSVEYYLTNKYYDIDSPRFGQSLLQPRFDDCEQYEFKMITDQIETILFRCVNHNSSFLKRRAVNVVETPKEFQLVELQKQVKNNLESFPTPTELKNNIYNPSKVDVIFNDPKIKVDIKTIDTHPIDHTPTPKEVIVQEANNHYQYKVSNTSTNASLTLFVKFVNAHGDTCEKVISPGKTITICAQKDTVSVSTKSASNTSRLGVKTAVNDDPVGFVYNVSSPIAQCNTVDISDTAPVIINTTADSTNTTTAKIIVRDTTTTTTIEKRINDIFINTPRTTTSTTTTTTIRPITTTTTMRSISTSTGGCFVEGTIVTLANGAKIAIEEVVVGMEVLTWNEASGQQEVGVVNGLIQPMRSDIISISFDNESIECTTDHPLFVVGKGWASYNPSVTKINHNLDVAELVEGDMVLNESDEAIIINSIMPIMITNELQTYNLSIEGNHTYYANGVLVHNKVDSSIVGGSGSGGTIDYGLNQYEPGAGTNNNTGMPVRGGSTAVGTRNLATGGG